MGPARPLRVAVARALESFQSHESAAWRPGAAWRRRRRSSAARAPRPAAQRPPSLRESRLTPSETERLRS